MIKRKFRYNKPFLLESGIRLDGLSITYHISDPATVKDKDVVWICHALTANSDPSEWWPGMVGQESYSTLRAAPLFVQIYSEAATAQPAPKASCLGQRKPG